MPGVLAVVTHEDVPDVLYGDLAQDRRLFAKERVRFEGDVVAAVAADPRDRRRRGRRDRGGVRAPAGRQRHRGGAGGRRPADPRGVGVLRGRRRPGSRRERPRLLDDREGRRRRRDGDGRRGRQGPLRHRGLAGGADRAARAPGAVGGRPRHRLELDAGSLRGQGRRRARPADPAVPRSDRRPAARRRLRLQVRLPLRGACRRARARPGGP